MITEFMYVKYVKTSELQRVLSLLEGNTIASLKGTRSYSKNVDLLPIPHLPYITVTELKTNKLKLCFNSLINGEFSKEETFNLLNSVDEKPLSVVLQELEVFCNNNEFIGKSFYEETGNEAFLNKEYVAYFSSYPISREGESNVFVEEISNFRTAYEHGLTAYKLHSLDFKYVLDVQRWREITKMSRATKEYNGAVEKWTEYVGSLDNKIIKRIVEDIFPKSSTSGRVYKKGNVKGRWILSSCGSEL